MIADLAFGGLALALGGLVKGVAGFGLPAIGLGLLALIRPPTEAIALMLLPVLATNAWQALAGGALRPTLARLWSFLLAAGIGAAVAAGQLARADQRLLSGLLGLLLASAALLALFGPRWPAPSPKAERLWSPVFGLLSGVATGLTGSFITPAAPWLAALRLPPDAFVQGFGLGAVVATVALGVAMAGQGLLPASLGIASAAALIPAFAGMWLGRRVRTRLPEALFRRIVQSLLLCLGLYLAARALLA